MQNECYRSVCIHGVVFRAHLRTVPLCAVVKRVLNRYVLGIGLVISRYCMIICRSAVDVGYLVSGRVALNFVSIGVGRRGDRQVYRRERRRDHRVRGCRWGCQPMDQRKP